MKMLVEFSTPAGVTAKWLKENFQEELARDYLAKSDMAMEFSDKVRLHVSDHQVADLNEARAFCSTESEAKGCAVAVRVKRLPGVSQRMLDKMPRRYHDRRSRIAKLAKSPTITSGEEAAQRFTQIAFLRRKLAQQTLPCTGCGSKISSKHVLKPNCPVCFGEGTLIALSEQRAIVKCKEKIDQLRLQCNEMLFQQRSKEWLTVKTSEQYGWVVGLLCEKPVSAGVGLSA